MDAASRSMETNAYSKEKTKKINEKKCNRDAVGSTRRPFEGQNENEEKRNNGKQ